MYSPSGEKENNQSVIRIPKNAFREGEAVL